MRVKQVDMMHKRRTAFKRFKYIFRDDSPIGQLMFTTNKQYLFKVFISSVFSFCFLLNSSQSVVAQPIAQASHATSYEIKALEFHVVDIERPFTRQGKLLNTPRNIYLESSRPATAQEARALSRAEKRALKRRQRRNRYKTQAENIPWEGQILKVFRLGPPMPNQDQEALREDFEQKLRQYREQKLTQRNQKIDDLAFRGLPVAKSQAPKQVASLLETGDDDDELGSEELQQGKVDVGSFCGGADQACCEIEQEAYCKPSLVCVSNKCIKAEIHKENLTCGDFEQRCCDHSICHVSSLVCSDHRCQLPPLKPQRIKTPVGILQISKVKQVYNEQGELIKSIVQATVRYDALKSSKNNRAFNAIRIGDYARWYSR